MAVKNLFKEVNKALIMYQKSSKFGRGGEASSYDKLIQEQAQGRIHEIYYTNTFVENFMLTNIDVFIFSGTGRFNQSTAGQTSRMPNTVLSDKKIVATVLKEKIKKNIKKMNIPTTYKHAIGNKFFIGTRQGTLQKKLSKAERKKREKKGYVSVTKNNETGGGVLITMYGGSSKYGISPFRGVSYTRKKEIRDADGKIISKKGAVSGKDPLIQVQHAVFQKIYRESIKEAQKDKRIKRILTKGSEIDSLFRTGKGSLGHALMTRGKVGGLAPRKFSRGTKLHAGAGSQPFNPPGTGGVPASQRDPSRDDPGFGEASDTTTRMIDFLTRIEDTFEGGPNDDLYKQTDNTSLKKVAKLINAEFNAGYSLEGIDQINLFGLTGKRFVKSPDGTKYNDKDIIAAKDIIIKIAFGTDEQQALAGKADKSGAHGGMGGLDGFFDNLEQRLLATFKNNPKMEASLSIEELARRGVFANVAKTMKTASGMPDMRFKVNKKIFAEAQRKHKPNKGKSGMNLQKASISTIGVAAEKVRRSRAAQNAGTKRGSEMIKNRTNPLALESILEQMLPKVVASKMTAPALVYRSGRFANSVAPAEVMIGPRGGISVDYTYMREPYETFEPGGKQGSTLRDPRKIIGSSVREVAQSIVGDQFIRVRRV